MKGIELLNNFKNLPEQRQTEILVDAYEQIAVAHDNGYVFDPFSWRDCQLDDGVLTINSIISESLDAFARIHNHNDYAALIYCLTTGSESSRAMLAEAGQRIKPAVLREIVLTLCGRNYSIDPLIKKLRQPYIDEDTFFDGYTTVDEKEAREAYEKQKWSEPQNWASAANNTPRTGFVMPKTSWWKSCLETIGTGIAGYIFFVICACVYRGCNNDTSSYTRSVINRHLNIPSISYGIRNSPAIRRNPDFQHHTDIAPFNPDLTTISDKDVK